MHATCTISPGARASLDLSLTDARCDLERLIEEHNGYVHQADVFRALADEASSTTQRVSRNAEAVKYRLRAVAVSAEISALRSKIACIESKLAGEVAAPVVLTAEQVSAMDEMAGVL